MLFCITLLNIIYSLSDNRLRKYNVIATFQDGTRGRSILLSVSYLLMSMPSEGQNLSPNQIQLTYLHSRLRYYCFRYGKQTSAILEFYFRFRFRPFPRNLQVILHQAIEFRPNGSTRCGNMTSLSIYQDVGRGRLILLPVSYLLTSLPSEGQSLSANQISSTYLNLRLRYNYFRFGRANVRHIGILLPVSISTIFFVICVLFCIRLPNFVQIGAPTADI